MCDCGKRQKYMNESYSLVFMFKLKIRDSEFKGIYSAII